MSFVQPDAPLVSVVMPVYNAATYLPAAIESILTQTHEDFEFIIADDGSADNSAVLIQTFAARDRRIRPLFLPHGGQAKAGNACVEVAQGRWLARMDADDVALPQRLAIQLAWLQESNVDVGGCSFVKRFGNEDGFLWFPASHAAIQHELLFRVGLLQPTMMLSTALAKAYPYAEQSAFEDYEWQLRLARQHRLGNLPQVLHQYRCHPTQVHIQRSDDFQADLRRYRRPHFFSLFPEATARDYTALAHVLDRIACPTLAELALAGQWLVRLAQGQEQRLREKMAGRWQATCLRSAGLGADCYQLYARYAPQFQVPEAPNVYRLRIACALQLRHDTQLHRSYLRYKLAIGRLAWLFNRQRKSYNL